MPLLAGLACVDLSPPPALVTGPVDDAAAADNPAAEGAVNPRDDGPPGGDDRPLEAPVDVPASEDARTTVEAPTPDAAAPPDAPVVPEAPPPADTAPDTPADAAAPPDASPGPVLMTLAFQNGEPVGWHDTAPENSLVAADGFHAVDAPGGGQAIATTRTSSDRERPIGAATTIPARCASMERAWPSG